METIASFACEHAHSAHWIIFLLLILAGMNVPISEDFLILIGGAIASLCVPDRVVYLFVWIYVGCWISAWEAYSIGRYLGPKIYNLRWFNRIITPRRIEVLHSYYEKFGVLTFIIGRFIPGGVRNALFMSAGLGKMPFLIFIARDAVACLISCSALFYIGYISGEHLEQIISFLAKYDKIAFIFFCTVIAIAFIYLWKKSHSKCQCKSLSSK